MEKEDKHIHIKEAHEKVEAGEPLAAIAVLTQILAQDGNDKEALLLRAEVFQSKGCPKEAEADIDRILPATEDSPEEALLRKAALRLAQGDAESAILYYNKVKEQHPRQGNAYIGLSTAYTATHRLDLALAIMDEALKRLPDFSEGTGTCQISATRPSRRDGRPEKGIGNLARHNESIGREVQQYLMGQSG